MPPRDLAAGLLVVLIWGLNVAVIKAGVGELPPLAFTAVRFALVAAVTLPFFAVPWRRMGMLALLSVTFGVGHFALLFIGMKAMDGATAGILVQLGVPFATLLSVLFLGERLGPWRLGGLLIAFAGGAVLAGEPTMPGLWPFLAITGSALGWAVSNLLLKRLTDVSPLVSMGWLSLFAVPQTALLSWGLEGGQIQALTAASWIGWGAVAYTALASSVLSYWLWGLLLRRHPLSAVVPLSLLSPGIGVVACVALLDEALTWQKVAGGVLTICGVGLILWSQSRKADRWRSPARADR